MSFLSDNSSAQTGRGRRTKSTSLEATVQTNKARASKAAEDSSGEKQEFKVNEEGRYICPMCDKTFKTVSRSPFVNAPLNELLLIQVLFVST